MIAFLRTFYKLALNKMEKYTKGCILFYLCGSSAKQMSVTAHGANTFNKHGTANHAEPQITLETHKKMFFHKFFISLSKTISFFVKIRKKIFNS